MILSRRKDASSNFLDNLAAKYSNMEKGKTKVFKGTKKVKKGQSAVKSESEEENEPADSDESLMTESDESETDVPIKRRSSLVKNKSVGKKKSVQASFKRKVKRL